MASWKDYTKPCGLALHVRPAGPAHCVFALPTTLPSQRFPQASGDSPNTTPFPGLSGRLCCKAKQVHASGKGKALHAKQRKKLRPARNFLAFCCIAHYLPAKQSARGSFSAAIRSSVRPRTKIAWPARTDGRLQTKRFLFHAGSHSTNPCLARGGILPACATHIILKVLHVLFF